MAVVTLEDVESLIMMSPLYGFSSSTFMPHSDSVHLTCTFTARKDRVIVLHEAMDLLLWRLLQCIQQGFSLEDTLSKCGGAFLHFCLTAAISLK